MKFAYQAEKFAQARRSLMLPFPRGPAEAIAHAFHECSLGLDDLRDEDLDDEAHGWVSKVRELTDTSGLDDPSGRGLWVIKAQSLTEEQQFELSRAVDELAYWFDRQFWGNE